MTDEQLKALNDRLDRMEASTARIEERIDTWREALESVLETLRLAANRLKLPPAELGGIVGKELRKALRPKR